MTFIGGGPKQGTGGLLAFLLCHFAKEGGLLSYGTDQLDIWRRAATYVDRILRGEKPGDLPVQLSVKYEMIVNRNQCARSCDTAIDNAARG